MKIAIAQINYIIGDIETNKIKIISAINRAKSSGVDLLVFAEQAISGAPAYELLDRLNFLEACEEALVEIAACCDGIAVLIGLPLQYRCATASAAAFIRNCHVVRYITKSRVELAEELGYIGKGDGCGFVKFNGKRIAVILGHDVYNYAEYVNCDIAVVMCADRYYLHRPEWRDDFITKHSFMANTTIVYANQVGANTGTIYDGGSMVCDSHGRIIERLKFFEEDFGIVDIDADNCSVAVDRPLEYEQIYDALVLGIRDFFAKNGYREACVVATGGIDSSVVTALAVAALGSEHVHALKMPSRYSNDHSDKDAEQLCRNLGVKFTQLPLNNIYSTALDQFEPILGEPTAFTRENFMLRLRCSLLMAACDQYGFVPLNTSNKTEMAFGGATLYGDGVGELSVLGDVYKSAVFSLARYINSKSEIIPEGAFVKTPTSELFAELDSLDDQLSYEVVDAILYRIIEEGQSTEEITNSGSYDSTTVERVASLLITTTPKRFQMCPLLRVTVAPFDKNQRILPLTCKYDF